MLGCDRVSISDIRTMTLSVKECGKFFVISLLWFHIQLIKSKQEIQAEKMLCSP